MVFYGDTILDINLKKFIEFENYMLDVVGGYHPKNINSKTKFFDDEEYTENLSSKEDKFYINLYLGINF